MAEFSEIVEEVRSRNDIVDIIGSYVNLKQKGSSYFGLCPFHSEKTPSFSVSRSKQMYYCFGCQRGGNVFTFLQEYEQMTFREALETLAEKVGVEIPAGGPGYQDRSRDELKKRMLDVNKAAAVYYAYQLKGKNGKNGLDYFTGRGLTEETIRKFGLGYSNITSDDLVLYLRSKGYDDQLLIDSGLAVFDEKHGLHDRFWNRVMYPIMDAQSHVIGFGGRVMGEGEPKYLNTRESLVFDKGRNLYGLNLARRSRAGYLILCEGYMDVIAMHQAGFDMAVASLGTAFTSGQASLIHRYASRVYLAYDSDGAGTNATLKHISVLREAGVGCKVINLSPQKDPDEFIKTNGADAFKSRIEDAEDAFLFEIRIMVRDYDLKAPDSRSDFMYALAEKLLVFEDDIRRDNYLEAVASTYSLPAEKLSKAVAEAAGRRVNAKTIDPLRSGIQSGLDDEEVALQNQRYLITWLADEPEIYGVVKKYIEPDDFSDEICHKVVTQMYEDIERGKPNPAAIISSFADESEQSKVASLFNTVLTIDGSATRESALHDIIYLVKKHSVESRRKSDSIDEASVLRQMNDKKALEELRRTAIKL